MAATKIKALAVKVGEYKQGEETKSRYRNIGHIWKDEEGHLFCTLDALCLDSKLVGVNARATKNFEDKIFCSVFEERPKGQAPKTDGQAPAPDDDEIPF